MIDRNSDPADILGMKRIVISLLLIFLSCLAIAEETGLASFYAGKFQGRLTANGEVFDTNKLTAAHKTLPFNTIVKVTNLESGDSVLVRINDRGPFVEGRVIDLSRAAAKVINIVGQGIGSVRLDIVRTGDGATYHNTGIDNYGFTTIQVASYRELDNAERTRKILENAGFIVRFEVVGSGFTRVLIPSVKRENVLEAKAELQALGYFNVLLRRQ